MSQGSGGGNYSGRGEIKPNSVLEVTVRLAPLRGVSIHSGKPRPSFRSPAWLGDGASEEVTPPAASAPPRRSGLCFRSRFIQQVSLAG